jgi:hypothetical protein
MRLIACLKAEQADIPMRVAELIDATIASWNTQKLEEFFLPMDIEVIRSIPINSRWHDDL